MRFKLIISVLLILSILMVGCAKTQEVPAIQKEEKPLCNPPYVEYKTGECCLDQNSNNVCDNDETKSTEEMKEIPKTNEEQQIPETIVEENAKAQLSIKEIDVVNNKFITAITFSIKNIGSKKIENPHLTFSLSKIAREGEDKIYEKNYPLEVLLQSNEESTLRIPLEPVELSLTSRYVNDNIVTNNLSFTLNQNNMPMASDTEIINMSKKTGKIIEKSYTNPALEDVSWEKYGYSLTIKEAVLTLLGSYIDVSIERGDIEYSKDYSITNPTIDIFIEDQESGIITLPSDWKIIKGFKETKRIIPTLNNCGRLFMRLRDGSNAFVYATTKGTMKCD